MTADPRLTPARADLAAAHLEGKVQADRFAAPRSARVSAPKSVLQRAPAASSSPETELLYGEEVAVYDVANGWAWVQSALDDYVGYVPAQNLSVEMPAPTHRITTLGAQIYPRPELKLPPVGRLPFGARVTVAETVDGYARVAQDRWIALPQLTALEKRSEDWVAIAEMFQGVPYVWGGRSSWGLDCSALVQLARQSAGTDCPRDSDMQQSVLGETLGANVPHQRGDLIFWKGHVGIATSAGTLLHANAHHMAVTLEPLQTAVERIAAGEFGEITRRVRLDG